MTDFWKGQVPTWIWFLIVIGACFSAYLWANNFQLFDTQLGITLVIIEVPLGLIGSIIIRTILNESRKDAEAAKRVQDEEKHVSDLVDIIYSRLLTLRIDITNQNKLIPMVERYREWSQTRSLFPADSLWMPIYDLPEPWLEFAFEHLKAYEDIHSIWQDIKRQIKEANSEHLDNQSRSEWAKSLSDYVLPLFTEKIRNLVNDLNAGIELKGTCRRKL